MTRALLTASQILSIWSRLPPVTVTERLELSRTPLEVMAPTETPPFPSSLEVDPWESLNSGRPLTTVLAHRPGDSVVSAARNHSLTARFPAER
jgi:hypothetical protein